MADGTVDYFDFFGLPRQISIDQGLLKKSYYENMRSYHPDTYDGESDDAERQSALNNEAYKTLANDESRIIHLLDLQGEWPEKPQLPQLFLMEMMDLNEKIMEWKMDGVDPTEEETIRMEIASVDQELNAELQNAIDGYDSENTDNISKLRDALLKRRYLKRLEENLESTSPDI